MRRCASVSPFIAQATTAGEIWTRTEVIAAGFPSDPSKPADDIFAVFSIAADDAFKSMSWDGRKIEKAIARFLNRQRPAYKSQLTTIHRERAKPQLVSLADLQLALVPPA